MTKTLFRLFDNVSAFYTTLNHIRHEIQPTQILPLKPSFNIGNDIELGEGSSSGDIFECKLGFVWIL